MARVFSWYFMDLGSGVIAGVKNTGRITAHDVILGEAL